MGYADAQSYLAQKKPEGLPFSPEITQMRGPFVGVAFREVMTGNFAMGETDPAAGAAKGQREGTTLAMHAAISIQDLGGFLADPEHLGQMNGAIDFAPFGQNILTQSDVFKLFCPTPDPKLTLMVYEMGFVHDGQRYYLAGKKEVRKHSFIHLWHDTTTLYTQLHRGTDKSGEVVGAGILSLGPLDLLKMGGTMHALNAGTVTSSVKALVRFAWFFVVELWNTYFRR